MHCRDSERYLGTGLHRPPEHLHALHLLLEPQLWQLNHLPNLGTTLHGPVSILKSAAEALCQAGLQRGAAATCQGSRQC